MTVLLTEVKSSGAWGWQLVCTEHSLGVRPCTGHSACIDTFNHPSNSAEAELAQRG